MPRLLPILFCAFGYAAAVFAANDAEVPWRCSELSWVGDPKMNEGRLEAEVLADCSIALATPALRRIKPLERLRDHFVAELKRDGASVLQQGRLYEVTRASRDTEGDLLKVKEKVSLGGNGVDALDYRTDSLEVEGEGMSKYLKRVDYYVGFSRPDEQSLRLKLGTRLAIERPWYAPCPLFFLIGKSKVKSKFEKRLASLLDGYMEWLKESEGQGE